MPRLLPKIAVGLAALVATMAAFRLIGFAKTSIFFVDECWHALVARAMAEAGTLLTSTTALMGVPYHLDYPPLFHLLNAVAFGFAGTDAFPYTNVLCAGALVAMVLLGPTPPLDPLQRATVALALVATPLFAMYSVRFYAEMLTALLFFLSWQSVMAAWLTGARGHALGAGVATGLLLWTKQLGVLVLGSYVLLLAWAVVRGYRVAQRTMAVVIGVAAAVAAPYFVLAFARGEHPFLFAFAGRHPELWSAAMTGVEVPRGVFLGTIWATYGVLPLVLLVLPLGLLATPLRRDYPYGGFLAVLAAMIGVFLLDPRLVERHTLFLFPAVAMLGVDALTRLTGRRGAWAGFALVLLFATFHVVTMPNYRAHFNPSREFVRIADVITRQTPPDATVLTVWWVEVRAHTGRRTLWPVPNVDNPPVELFEPQTAEEWYARLRARGVTHLLVDRRYVAERPGYGFSQESLTYLDQLTASGRVTRAASIGPYQLFAVA